MAGPTTRAPDAAHPVAHQEEHDTEVEALRAAVTELLYVLDYYSCTGEVARHARLMGRAALAKKGGA